VTRQPATQENRMLRKIASIVYLLTAAFIGLGAFGHDSNAGKLAQSLAGTSTFEATDVKVILAVWHFCSGCMLVFGAITVWTWRRWRAGERKHFPPSDAIAVFYAIAGVASVVYTGVNFFWLFFGLGALLLASSLILRRAA